MDGLARRLRLKLFRTSVKENFNVEQGVRGRGRKGREGWTLEEGGRRRKEMDGRREGVCGVD